MSTNQTFDRVPGSGEAGPDYLWDGAGEPDEELRAIEAELRAHAVMPDAAPMRLPSQGRARRFVAPFAAAAIVALALSVAALAMRASRPSWGATALAGAPMTPSGAIKGPGRLRVGQWLETDSASSARLEVETFGSVTVGPGSRVRLVEVSGKSQRLALARGRILATITAPPRLFLVETPACVAADLGCEYSLEVDSEGLTVLEVLSGWVALESNGVESVAPAGAVCRTTPGGAPGAPVFRDAPEALLQALARLESDPRNQAALDDTLSAARPRDSLTLWHLLARVDGNARRRVYERLDSIAPAPSGVNSAAVLSLDQDALRAWWADLPRHW